MDVFEGQLTFEDIYEKIPIPYLDLLFEARVKLLEERNKRQEEAMRAEQEKNERDRKSSSGILPPNMRP